VLQKLRATGEVLFTAKTLKLLGSTMVTVKMNLEKLLVSEVNSAVMAREIPRVSSPRLIPFIELAGSPWGCSKRALSLLRSLGTIIKKIFNCCRIRYR